MDKNFIQQDTVAREEVDWYDARKLPLYGLIPEQELLGRRLPKEIAAAVNDGILTYSAYGAGDGSNGTDADNQKTEVIV